MAGTALAAAPLKSKLVPAKLSEHAWFVRGGTGVASAQNEGFNSNAGFVVTTDGVVVIDVLGTPALGQALLDAIRKVTDKPVKRVILTHYHADHFYGLAPFKAAGAEIWAHQAALEYLDGGEGARRLEQRSLELADWVPRDMPLVHADKWLAGDERFTLGGVAFEVVPMGPAHSPEDLMIVLPGEGVVFSGDLFFAGRIPFVGEADSKRWLARIDSLLATNPKLMVPGHGDPSRDPRADLVLTRDYLTYLRETMGRAVEAMTPFEEAYAATGWSRFKSVPAFDAANRVNAYGQYLLMERESLRRPDPAAPPKETNR